MTVSGFGSAGYTTTNTDQAEFTRFNQVEGASKSSDTVGVDSMLGLQVSKQVNNWLSFTGQGLVRKNASPDFVAELTWAFAKAQITPEISVRVGRIGAPVYMVSDYINVGYANTMLRSPVEMYSQGLFDKLDGVDMVWTQSFGDTAITSQLAHGKAKAKLSVGGTAEADPVTSLNITAEHGPVSVRVARSQGKVSLPDNPSFNALYGALTATGFQSLGDRLALKDKDASFTSLGMTADWKNIVLQSELAKRKVDGYAADTTSWYVMSGYRIGDFLPYYTHSELKQDSARTDSTIPMVGPYLPLAIAVNSAIAQGEQTSNSIGVRWDFDKSAALKVQADRISPKSKGGLFTRQKPEFSGDVTVIAATVDFTF